MWRQLLPQLWQRLASFQCQATTHHHGMPVRLGKSVRTDIMNRVAGFTTTANQPLSIHAFLFTMMDDGSHSCHMRVKGSTSDASWYEVGSVRGANGFLVLTSIPQGFPLSKRPNQFRIQTEYLNRIKGNKIKASCLSACNQDTRPYEDLLVMANTLVLPSGGPITDREFAALEPCPSQTPAWVWYH